MVLPLISPAVVACRAVAGGQFLRSCSLPSRRCFQCPRHGSTCRARQRRRPAVVTDHPVDSRCPARLRAPTSCRLGHDRLSVRPGPVWARSRLGCDACCPCSEKSKRGAGITVGLASGELGWVVFSRGRLTRLPGVNSPLVANPQRESPVEDRSSLLAAAHPDHRRLERTCHLAFR